MAKSNSSTKALLGLAVACAGLFGSTATLAFTVGRSSVTRDDVEKVVAEKVDGLRTEITLRDQARDADQRALRAEIMGAVEALRAEVKALGK